MKMINDLGMVHAEPQALYIHIPFCTQKCFYCDFTTYALRGQPVADYIDALTREIQDTAAAHPGELRSIFIGGGTPTALTAPQLQRLLDAVRANFQWSEDVEFTVEANPGLLDAEKLAVLRLGGVNRLSIGVQTFNEALLARIGRDHSVRDVYESIAAARAAGFENISIDLIFGLPGQTLADVAASVQAALALKLTHYSLYGLILEDKTVFSVQNKRGELVLPPEEEETAMYELLMTELARAGYVQYEISNFALPGYESRHNMTYWRNAPYLGLGVGATGYVNGVRYENVRSVKQYIKRVGAVGEKQGMATGATPIQIAVPLGTAHDTAADVRHTSQVVLRAEAMENFMMLGLRMLRGVHADEFRTQFGAEADMEQIFAQPLAAMLKQGLLTHEEQSGRYHLTQTGILFGNVVFGAFVDVL
jgi:oxygen-independent coproporphyrinogen-3 oxidase